MTGGSVTKEQIIAKAVAVQKSHPELRLGQVIMDYCVSIKEFRAVPADLDPYLVETRVPQFLDWLLEHRNEKAKV